MKRDRVLIEADELLVKINDPKIRIYDTTIIFSMLMSPEEAAVMPTAHELYLAGHIPGAAFFDHQEFSDPDSSYEYMLASDEELEEQIGKIGIANDSQVIVYANGILACATRAWWILRYAGVENVRVFNGGLAAWKDAGGAVDRGEKNYTPAQFNAQFRPEMFASIEEVQAATGMEGVSIENALTQDWHDQEHIPGSSCLPLTDLTDGWETFIPEDQLMARIKGTGKHERIITYCGGGIAATLNAVAHLMAGDENVAVYDGSLFEWIGEGKPVASKE